MRNLKGFTLLELAVVVTVVALLVAVLLPKFYQLTLRAEALQVQGVIGTLRSALSVKVVRGLYSGEGLDANDYKGENALCVIHDLLDNQPESYLGVIENSDNRGSWYDDKRTHELVYVVKSDSIVSGIAGSPIKIRWRIEAVYSGEKSKNQFLGLVLQPATKHNWEIDRE